MGNFQARQKRQKLIVGLFLAVWGFITFVPFIWMILSSFKTNPEIMQLNQVFYRKILRLTILSSYSVI